MDKKNVAAAAVVVVVVMNLCVNDERCHNMYSYQAPRHPTHLIFKQKAQVKGDR